MGGQSREGLDQLSHGRFSLRAYDLRVWLVCKHGTHHESPGSARQQHDFVHGVEKDDGSEPQALYHDRVEKEGSCRQVGQDSEGFDLASLRHIVADIWFQLDEPTQFAGRIHRMIKLWLSIDDDDEGLGDDDDLPPLEEVEGAADEASKMEEVD